MASSAQGEGASSGSSSKRGRQSGGKVKVPKIKQRGMGIAQLEQLRIQSQMAAAAAAASTANAAAGSVVVPVYQLLDEGPRVYNPVYLSSLLASVPAVPQGVKENFSFLMPRYNFWHTSDPAPSWTPSGSHGPISQKMSKGTEGSDIQLGRLSTGRLEKEKDDDLEFQQPNYFTRLLLAGDDEEETGQKNKKARTDSSGDGSVAAAGSSSSQEPNLELRLFF